jgi:hypothetical protein
MRTQTDAKVKHPRASCVRIDHCSREMCKALEMPEARDDALVGPVEGPLTDGRYDAFILSAETCEHGVALSCTITSGAHRGDVIDIVAAQFATRDPLDLIGLPCTLVVAGDTIRIES